MMVLIVNYFHKKAAMQMFDKVLNMLLRGLGWDLHKRHNTLS